MNTRIEQAITLSSDSNPLADINAFCSKFSDHLYELAFKEIFINHQRDCFDHCFNFKVENLNIKQLKEVMTVWGNTETDLETIKDRFKKHRNDVFKSENSQLPADEDERDLLIAALGNYFVLQLRLAEFKYHYLTFIEENKRPISKQVRRIADEIKKQLPCFIDQLETIVSSTCSIPFVKKVFGIKLLQPGFFNPNAAELDKRHSNLNEMCSMLLQIANRISYTISGDFYLAEQAPDADKNTITRHPRKMRIREVGLEKAIDIFLPVVPKEPLQQEAVMIDELQKKTIDFCHDMHNEIYMAIGALANERIRIKETARLAEIAAYEQRQKDKTSIEQYVSEIEDVDLRTMEATSKDEEKWEKLQNFVSTIIIFIATLLKLTKDAENKKLSSTAKMRQAGLTSPSETHQDSTDVINSVEATRSFAKPATIFAKANGIAPIPEETKPLRFRAL